MKNTSFVDWLPVLFVYIAWIYLSLVIVERYLKNQFQDKLDELTRIEGRVKALISKMEKA